MDIREGKLIQLLAKIEESELKALMKFVKSPYHNSNKQIIPLLEKLLTYHPKFDYKKLTKEFLFRQIHPKGKPYHEGRMNLLMTNLVSVMQKFYRQQEFEQDQLLQKKLLGKAYNKRGFYKKYKKEVDGMLTLLENLPYREEDYFFQKYDIQQEFFFHNETSKSHESRIHFNNALDALDNFYLTAKLKLVAEQFTTARKLNINLDLRFFDFIIKYLKSNKKSHTIVIEIFYEIIRLRSGNHPKEEFDKVKLLFIKNLTVITSLKQKLIFYNLINYCVGQFNYGEKGFLEEIHSLYKFGLNQEYLTDNNIMTSLTFSNIVITSSNNGDFTWCENFILKNEKYLIKEEAYHTKLLANAFLNYRKGEIDSRYFYKTLDFLKEVKYTKKNITPFIRSRILWVRTCYELLKQDNSYYLTMIDYLKNFETQLNKDKILSKEVINRYLSFIYFTKKLLRISRNEKSKLIHINEVEKEIETHERIALKSWVVEKIKELQKKLLKKNV